MASYKIDWKRSVYHDIRKVDKQYISRILEHIQSLSENPRPKGCKKLADTEKTFRVRVGEYRIVYQTDDQAKMILIEYIRHRKDVYRKK
jgi:mRNA interferase RelE/StbE